MRVVVFAGPSIPAVAAAAIADFDYRPPAAQGDVTRAVWAGAHVIGLIDGYFESVPAVWHKEILFALSSGVHVFGAASMGALRAAELDSFGMRGVGRIYEWYASGALDADDEVALVHGPAEMDYASLSEPLVNVRATLDSAVSSGELSAASAASVLSAAKGIFYKDRTWQRIVAATDSETPELNRFVRWLAGIKVDQKRLDAEDLLRVVADFVSRSPVPFQATFSFERTDAWDLGVEAFQTVSSLSDQDMRVLDEMRLAPAVFGQLVQAAALSLRAPRDGSFSSWGRPSSRRLDAFRSERGLQSRQAFLDWLKDSALREAELAEFLAERDDAAEWLHRSRDDLLGYLIREIKLRGLYRSLAERGERKAHALSSKAHASAWRRPPARLVLEWFFEERLGRAAPDGVDELCRNLLLTDTEALQELLAREYLFATLES